MKRYARVSPNVKPILIPSFPEVKPILIWIYTLKLALFPRKVPSGLSNRVRVRARGGVGVGVMITRGFSMF